MLCRLHRGLLHADSRQSVLRTAREGVGLLTEIGGSHSQDGAQAVCSQLCSFFHQEVRAAALQAEACCHQLPLGPLPRVLQHAGVIRLTPETIGCSTPLKVKHASTVSNKCNGLDSQLCMFLYMTATRLPSTLSVLQIHKSQLCPSSAMLQCAEMSQPHCQSDPAYSQQL